MNGNYYHFSEVLSPLTRDGFALVPQLTDHDFANAMIAALAQHEDANGTRRNASGVYARRNLLEVPPVRDFANSPEVRAVIAPVLGEGFFAVRGILFDKTPGANWKVPWHQDLSIAVRARREVAGFGPWSQKAGVWHVQPPREILEKMVTLRWHLDECGEDNAPLRVLAGTHGSGKLSAEDIEAWRGRAAETLCLCPRGGALLMRPLLLHASSAAKAPGHRRVVHIEFAAAPLPGGLEWL